MCSNMCARPVIPGTSWAAPTFTIVANEKTGASGRSMTMTVSPLSSFLAVTRFSTDDVLTAWYGTQWAPRVGRAADLGSGIGSVALVVAWRLPGATLVTVEAQAISVRLARKSVRYNGLESRVDVREGDLRDAAI